MKTAASSRSEKVLLTSILNQVADGVLQPLLEAVRHAIVEELLVGHSIRDDRAAAGASASSVVRGTLPFALNYAGHGSRQGWSSQVHLLGTCVKEEISDGANEATERRPAGPAVAAGWAGDSARSVDEQRFAEFAQSAGTGSAPLIGRVPGSTNGCDGLLLWLPLTHRRQTIGHLAVSLWDSRWASLPGHLPSAWSSVPPSPDWEHPTWALPVQWSHPRYRAHVPAWLVRLATQRRELAALRDGFTRWNRIRRDLEQVLMPTIRTASWKEKAGRIMHELANSISTMDAPLESIAQELSRSLLDLRYRKEDADGPLNQSGPETLTDTIERLRGTVGGFDFLRRNQAAAKNKVLWYFFLMEGKLKAEEEEILPLRELLADTCHRLDPAREIFRFAVTDDAAWATALAMPPQFLGHCAQALLSNAVRHRLPGSRVEFAIGAQDDGSLLLEWTNAASRQHLDRLHRASNGSEHDTFGLAVAREVSREFLGSELVISPDTDRVHHAVRLQRCSAQPNVFFSLNAWMQSRKGQGSRRFS